MRELIAPSTSRLSPRERLRAALDDLLRASRGDGADLYVPDSEGSLRHHLGAGRASQRPSREREADGLVDRAWHERRAFASEDAEQPGLGDLALAPAAVAIPLFGLDRVLGVVRIAFATRPELGADSLQRLDGAVDRVGALLQIGLRPKVPDMTRLPGGALSEPDRELDRLKTRFLSMVSHELRTPLTAIIGYTDLLLRQVHGGLTERQVQHQVAVRKAADRLLSLINNLLDVTRLESGLVELHRQSVALREVFDACVHGAASAADEAEIELRCELADRGLAVDADPERLQQVIANLLDNAIKFTPAGGSVTLAAERAGPDVRVRISDTGVGVATQEIVKVWDRLHQADSSMRRRFGGSGLGLAIVRQVVELHGGRVVATSGGQGRGSTFTFTLPVASLGRPTELAARQASVEESAATTVSPLRVLVVDDDLDNRDVIASIVADVLGHGVILAADGRQCLDRAREHPDLILLDLRMPDIDGFEVTRLLKGDALTAHIPIIALTALTDHDDQDAALAAGCAGCVTKPFTPANLGAAVARAVGRQEPGVATAVGSPTAP